MIFFSKVLVGVALGLLIEPGKDDAKIIIRVLLFDQCG